MVKGVAYRCSSGGPDEGEKPQLLMPMLLRDQVLYLAHDSPLAGHLGFEKTWDRIKWCVGGKRIPEGREGS